MRTFSVWLIAGWVGGMLILASLVLRIWSGDHWFLARYTGYLMPWLLLVLLPGGLWAAWMHYRYLAILLGISAIIVVTVYAPLFWSRAIDVPNVTSAVKVVSYNTWSKNLEIHRIARVIVEQKPDILLLQEITPKAFSSLMVRLKDLYSAGKVHFSYEPGMLLAVVSRFPTESQAITKGKGRVQKVVLHSPIGPIAVYNVHMLRHGGWASRYRKISRLLEQDLVHEQRPVILGGDFNAPDQSETYRYITGVLDNAHWNAGFGFGFSFPASSIKLFGLIPIPPLVRIDHIFINSHFVTLQARTIKDSGGSDHFPVVALLKLK